MAAALKHGGWLVVEEYVPPERGGNLPFNLAGRPFKSLDVTRQVKAARGVDLHYGWRLPERFGALGLSDIGAEGRIFRVTGGSPGSRVTRANMEQLHDAILATGNITEQEFADDLATLSDPAFAYPSTPMWAVWGRRQHL